MPSSPIHRNGEILECPMCKSLFIRLPSGKVEGSCGHQRLKQIVGVLPDGELEKIGIDGVLSELKKDAAERAAAMKAKVSSLFGSPSIPSGKAHNQRPNTKTVGLAGRGHPRSAG